uniref:hypothetical protein n=1 Tax=Actinokineospora sp. CA-119265 TaxID=3239890 RepID=UPI003F4941CA
MAHIPLDQVTFWQREPGHFDKNNDAHHAREWELIHQHDAYLKSLPTQADRAAHQQLTTTCGKCGVETAVAVRCHGGCGDWL